MMFFTADLNVRISLKYIYTKFELFRLALFKILQFKIADFPFIWVLLFCQYCDRVRLLLDSWSTFLENHEHAVTLKKFCFYNGRTLKKF